MDSSLNAKKVIDEIYQKNWKMSNPEQAIDQESMLKIISQKIYPDSNRFLMELIQNFDDSSLSSNFLELTFTICDNFIMASHQGKAFDEYDVNSICSSGNSTKMKNHQSTGNMGIGFKSVFMHSNKVIIISKDYCFRFDKEHFDNPSNCWQDDWGKFNLNYKNLRKPWQKIPLWTDINELDSRITSISKNYENNFVFYFHSPKIFDSCKNYIYKVLDDPFYFLFLKCQNIKIEIIEKEKQKNLIKFSNFNGNSRITINDTECYYFYVKKYEFFMPEDEKIKLQVPSQLSNIQISIEDSSAPQKFKDLRKVEFSFGIQLESYEKNKFRIISLPKEKRVIYNLLPTNQNFNFPFLLNANFYLDAGRTQIIDDPWNLLIFGYLPKYINTYLHEDLFEKFGNSFCECLIDLQKINILNQNFLNIFNINIEIYKNNKILVKTINGQTREISKCIFNNFNIQLNENNYVEFLDFLKLIFEDKLAEKIILEYFESKSLIYDISNFISNGDVNYASKLLQYYPNNEIFYTVTQEEVYKFIESSIYTKYINAKSFKNLLTVLASMKNLDSMRISKTKFILDFNFNYKFPNELLIFEENNSSSYEDNSLATRLLRLNNVEINYEWLSILDRENILKLNSLGVRLIYPSKLAEYILEDFQNIYNNETSIPIIRVLFDYTSKNDNAKTKQIYEVLSKCKFLSENDRFLCLSSLHIGKYYYTQSSCKFSEFGISRKYYKDGSNLENWVEFFSKIGIIFNQENIIKTLSVEELKESPFFDLEYKNVVLKSINSNPVKITIYPILENLLDTNDHQKITAFFKKFWKPFSNKRNNNIPCFLEWNIFKIRKLVPNQNHTLVPIDHIYNEDLIKKEIEIYEKYNNSEKIEDLLNRILNFPHEKIEKFKCTLIQNEQFHNQLRLEDRVHLLQSIINENSSTRSNDGILKLYFSKLLSELAIMYPNYTYTFDILDKYENFKSPKDLYYIDINATDFLFKASLDKTSSKLHIPQFDLIFKSKDDDLSYAYTRGQSKYQDILQKYLNFCIKCGVKVIRKKDLHKVITDQVDDDIINNHFKNINFFENLKTTMIRMFKSKKDLNKLRDVKFYSCSNILIKSDYGDNFDLVAYMEITDKTNKYNIYYLKDDTFSWSHPTILYFIAKFLAIVIEEERAEMEILTLLRMNSAKEVEFWISKSYKGDD